VRADLIAAYRRTLYRARFPEREIDLRVGRRSPALDAALAARASTRWSWLTALNPRSVPLADDENARRLAELDAALAAAGWASVPGVALDPLGAWPPEPSRLVLANEPRELRALARRFEQNALLEGEAGAAPRLVLLADVGLPED
jgi:hypothetical protein